MTFQRFKHGLPAIVALLAAAVLVPHEASARTREKASCTVTIDSVNVAVIGGGGGGEGRLTCRGKSYRFSIGGGSLGSLGVSRMHATGTVYRLTNLSDFEGVYGQVSAGGSVGPAGREALMLQNEHGVVMRLQARSKGLSVTLGGAAMVVQFK